MKKILSLLSVLALLVSFGMAFSVTGEVKTKFLVDGDTFVDLNFDDAFKFKYSLDQGTVIAPQNYNTNTIVGAFTPTSTGTLKFYDFKVSDNLFLGVEMGMSAYSMKKDEQTTNAGAGTTNATQIDYMSMKIKPLYKYVLSDTMSIQELDTTFGYWSGKGTKKNNTGDTNDWIINNPLQTLGFGAQVVIALPDFGSLAVGASYTIDSENMKDSTTNKTNTYNDNTSTIRIAAKPIYKVGDSIVDFRPEAKIIMVNDADIVGSSTNSLVGSTIELFGYVGDKGDLSKKYDSDDQKDFRKIVMDNITINPFLTFDTYLSSSFKSITGSSTNDLVFSKLLLVAGVDKVAYKIDDTYTVVGEFIFTLDNVGADIKGTITNLYYTNKTMIEVGGRLDIAIAPKATVHAGLRLITSTTVSDNKDSYKLSAPGAGAPYTNNVSAATSVIEMAPIFEFGGEKTVGDFVIEVAGRTKIYNNVGGTNTTYTPGTAEKGGTDNTSYGLSFVNSYDASLKYTKDDAFFKIKVATSGTAMVGAEAGYKF